ncbi:hypothetical protein [Cupriavidus alkaliphilus]|uniref:Uncharacterized protein n=1 Tax=Cupriavidus alkaliphilus TaxID=942866 RepID=A0A7W4YS48_9BURK|nr:hypothetical protein [Cupriavidus alkaliphilus]MBB3008097.1 hypothetical protein [Cupriavidus alkaliphilus]
MAENTECTRRTEANTQGLVELFDALSGGFKVIAWLGRAAKPIWLHRRRAGGGHWPVDGHQGRLNLMSEAKLIALVGAPTAAWLLAITPQLEGKVLPGYREPIGIVTACSPLCDPGVVADAIREWFDCFDDAAGRGCMRW